MRTPAWLAATVLVAAVLQPDPAGAPVAEHFASAGWSATDASTGALHVAWIITSGTSGEETNFEVSGSDTTPITCASGEPGERWVESGGGGRGVLTVRASLKGATFSGIADIDRTTYTFCDPMPEPTVEHESAVPVAFELTAVGTRWRDLERHSRRVPSESNLMWGSRAFGRAATGTLTIGDHRVATTFGDLGRVSATSHESWHEMESAVHANVWLRPHEPLSASTSADTGSLLRAEGQADRFDDDSYEGTYVGADRQRRSTIVYAASYRAETVVCPDGFMAMNETYRYGEGPGKLSVGGSFRSATVTARLDLSVTRVDGCTGDVTVDEEVSVPVRLDLRASGRKMTMTDRDGRLEPGAQVRHDSIVWAARPASGTVRLGPSDEVTGWAHIGRLRWQLHDTSR